jgi:hypothetical protein
LPTCLPAAVAPTLALSLTLSLALPLLAGLAACTLLPRTLAAGITPAVGSVAGSAHSILRHSLSAACTATAAALPGNDRLLLAQPTIKNAQRGI